MAKNTQTYQLESIVKEDGSVILPKPLQKHRVKLVVYDLDAIHKNPVEYFQKIVQNYHQITDEPNLDITEIYHEREQSNEPRTLFT
jgi:hypothetical protein